MAKSAALTAWNELNDRQQGTLEAIYDLDQETEAGRRSDAAQGYWDKRPASHWRQIDFAHDPSDRRLFGTTDLQNRWRDGAGTTRATAPRWPRSPTAA